MLGEANTKYQNVQGEPSKAEEAELSKPTATVKGCFSTVAGLEAEEPPRVCTSQCFTWRLFQVPCR